jgi:hypothetical protein
MISTKNISTLPNRDKLQKLCRSISVIEAIICEDWLDRYYSYNSKWADQEEFCEMKNGQGDSLQILFRNDGCVINGMTHEFYPKDKSKLTQGLPKIYDDFIFGEPVRSIGTTFCIWTNNENAWQIGELENFDDDSEEMLKIFDDNPQTYIDWATGYYEDGFIVNESTLNVVSDIYQGKVLTKSMVETLNKDIDHWQQLKEDLAEINYPNDIS